MPNNLNVGLVYLANIDSYDRKYLKDECNVSFGVGKDSQGLECVVLTENDYDYVKKLSRTDSYRRPE